MRKREVISRNKWRRLTELREAAPLAAGLRRQALPMFIVTGSQGRPGPRPQEFLEGKYARTKFEA
jgi:hypothetical protein